MVVAVVSFFTVAGCGSTAQPAATTFAEQVTQGQALFAANCASCHGDAGQGTMAAPALVGLSTGALPLNPPPTAKVRKTQFVMVADVANFAVANMPASAPGSLSMDDYWAILAFDLSANGITLMQPLTPELAATLTIPRN
jgi:cytochrome c